MKRSLKFSVVCALAGIAILASATGASAHAAHVYRVRGTGDGADQIGSDASCSGISVSGSGTVDGSLGDGTYTENLCAVWSPKPEVTTGDTTYDLTGTYRASTAKGDFSGTVTGSATYMETDGEYHYSITIKVTGGTGSYNGAHGAIRVRGIADYYCDCDTGTSGLSDSLSFRGIVKV